MTRTVRLTEGELYEIVKEGVSNYFKVIEARNGKDILKCGKIEGAIDKNINEGLIKTYPLQSTVDALIRATGFNPEQIIITGGPNDSEKTIGIILPLNIDNNFLVSLNRFMGRSGYFPQKDFKRYNEELGVIVYEPLFPDNVTREVHEQYKYLFHLVPSKAIEKVKKIGITPHGRSKGILLYPSRSYLMRGDKLNNIQKLAFDNVILNHKDIQEFSIIKLDVSLIPQSIQFYEDPMANGGIFTNETISPRAIVSITPYKN